MNAPNENIQAMVKTIIEAQIIQALNEAPEAIDKLVKAALSKEVDGVSGKADGYYGNRTPYLDYLIGDEIRSATRSAVAKVIKELAPNIEGEVRKALTAETLVAAVAKSIVATAEQDWKISVKFESEKERR